MVNGKPKKMAYHDGLVMGTVIPVFLPKEPIDFPTNSTQKLQAKEDFERARELEPDPAIDKELKRRAKPRRGKQPWMGRR